MAISGSAGTRTCPTFGLMALATTLAHRPRVEASAFKSLASAFAVFFKFVLTEETLRGFNYVLGCGHEAPGLPERPTLIITNTKPATAELNRHETGVLEEILNILTFPGVGIPRPLRCHVVTMG